MISANTVILGLSALLLIGDALPGSKAPPPLKPHEPAVEIHRGVCFERDKGYRIDARQVIDFTMVTVTKGGITLGRVYVGDYPDISSANDARPGKTPRFVALGGDQAGQYLGVPGDGMEAYYHIMPAKPELARELIAITYFCHGAGIPTPTTGR